MRPPALDTGSRTLAVKVGQQLALKVLHCVVVGFDAGAEGSDPQLVKDCQPDPQVKTKGPSVNGFAPWSSLLPLPVEPGSTLVSWRLSPVAP